MFSFPTGAKQSRVTKTFSLDGGREGGGGGERRKAVDRQPVAHAAYRDHYGL